jgi:hypothetical protein
MTNNQFEMLPVPMQCQQPQIAVTKDFPADIILKWYIWENIYTNMGSKKNLEFWLLPGGCSGDLQSDWAALPCQQIVNKKADDAAAAKMGQLNVIQLPHSSGIAE